MQPLVFKVEMSINAELMMDVLPNYLVSKPIIMKNHKTTSKTEKSDGDEHTFLSKIFKAKKEKLRRILPI